MGLLKSIGNLISSSVSKQTGAKIYDISNQALAILTSPIQSIINPEKARQETAKKGVSRLVAEGVTNVAVVTTPLTATGKAIAGKVVTSAVTGSPVKVVASTLGTAGLLGFASKFPEQTLKVLDPFTSFETGGKLGEIVKEPKGKIKDVLIGAGVIGAGVGITTAIVKGIEKGKKQDEVITPSDKIVSEVPITPQTQIIGKEPTTSSRKRAKNRLQTQGQTIKQSVNVIVSQKNLHSQKYLNKRIYA